jgi:hypothetical protein
MRFESISFHNGVETEGKCRPWLRRLISLGDNYGLGRQLGFGEEGSGCGRQGWAEMSEADLRWDLIITKAMVLFRE